MSPNVRPAADLSWSITGAVGAIVSIEVQDPIGELSLVAQPEFRCTETNDAATSTTLAGAVMSVTFPSAPPADFHISLPALNQGLRSSSGCYLAGGSQHFVPAATPPRSAFSRTGVSGSPTADVTINIAAAPITITLPAAPPDASWWQIGSDGDPADLTTVNAFGGALVMTVLPGELWYLGASGGIWTPTQVLIPAPPALPSFAFVGTDGPIAAYFTDISSGLPRTLTLPDAPTDGDCYTIQAESAGSAVTVNDFLGALVATLIAGQLVWILRSGGAWGANIRNP